MCRKIPCLIHFYLGLIFFCVLGLAVFFCFVRRFAAFLALDVNFCDLAVDARRLLFSVFFFRGFFLGSVTFAFAPCCFFVFDPERAPTRPGPGAVGTARFTGFAHAGLIQADIALPVVCISLPEATADTVFTLVDCDSLYSY